MDTLTRAEEDLEKQRRGFAREELEERVIKLQSVRLNWFGPTSNSRQEVEERKRAEEELSLQKTYFQHLFDNSPEASVILALGMMKTGLLQTLTRSSSNLFHYSIERS